MANVHNHLLSSENSLNCMANYHRVGFSKEAGAVSGSLSCPHREKPNMANTGEGQDSLRKSDDDAVRSRLGLGSDDAPPVAGELLFDDYDDGGGVDDLLGIVRDSADDNEIEDVVLATDDESDIEFEDDMIVFEDEAPAVQSDTAAVDSMAGVDEDVVEFSNLEDDDLVFGDDDDAEEDVAAAVAPKAEPREEEPDTEK